RAFASVSMNWRASFESLLSRVALLLPKLYSAHPASSPSTTVSLPGLIPPQPQRLSFALTKVGVVLSSGTILGAWVAKTGAAFLEDHELFVPSDEDDDD